MANTYELIASQTLATTATSITFSSIPSTYTDLELVMSARTNTNAIVDALFMSLNGSSASFTGKYLQGDGSTVVSGSLAQYVGGTEGSQPTANIFHNAKIYIPNYAGSNYKSYSADSAHENNATTAYAGLVAGLWSNTAAITSITIGPGSNSFITNSTFYLYGIKNS